MVVNNICDVPKNVCNRNKMKYYLPTLIRVISLKKFNVETKLSLKSILVLRMTKSNFSSGLFTLLI